MRDQILRRRSVLTLVAIATAVALVWALGRTVDRSHTAASDSELAAALQIARATLASDVSSAGRRAAALARLPRTQSAFSRRDAHALAAVAAAHPGSLLLGPTGLRAGSVPALGVRRVADVVAHGKTIGRVVTEAPLDSSYLTRVRKNLPAGVHDLLVVVDHGVVAAGSLRAGTPLTVGAVGDVHTAGHAYRAMSTPLASDRPQIRIVALASRGGGFMSGWRLPLAVLATLAAVALLVTWTAQPRRSRLPERNRGRAGRHREVSPAPPEPDLAGSVTLLGETLAATHDVEALLAVVLDAAIAATGAIGGTVDRGSGALPAGGDADDGALVVPLETDEPGGSSSLVLLPPPGGFTAESVAVAEWLATQASTALGNARLHRIVEEHALTDELTGLANRRRFTQSVQSELSRAGRYGTSVAVLVADLDNFKRINDRFGHAGGDDALRTFARALQRCIRQIDLAARLGGDEFAVLLPQTDAEGAREVAERLRAELLGESVPGRFTASFGASYYPAADSAEELLISADVCLYRAKESGRDRVVVVPDPPPGSEA